MNNILKYIPAALAHRLAPFGLRYYSEFFGQSAEWKSFSWRNLHFINRIGVAGGLDKNGDLLDVWPNLGVGFIEVGTVTPKPQAANPGKIVARDWKNKNLWNKMGFPNLGAKEISFNLLYGKKNIPIFVNIGKNRSTENEKAVSDYLECIQTLKPFADAFVINVSSPNTVGLRDLQGSENLKSLLKPIVKEAKTIPTFIKLSPDLTSEQLAAAIETSIICGISGFILTNTTLFRPTGCPFPSEGGLSGRDLAEKSKSILKETLNILGPRRKDFLLISVGGILNPRDVEERLAIGADLVQCYSALSFEGPGFFHKVANYFKTSGVQQ